MVIRDLLKVVGSSALSSTREGRVALAVIRGVVGMRREPISNEVTGAEAEQIIKDVVDPRTADVLMHASLPKELDNDDSKDDKDLADYITRQVLSVVDEKTTCGDGMLKAAFVAGVCFVVAAGALVAGLRQVSTAVHGDGSAWLEFLRDAILWASGT